MKIAVSLPERLGAVLIVLAAVVFAAAPASAQDAEGKLEDVERKLEADKERKSVLDRETRRLQREVGKLRKKMIAAADKVQKHEAAMTEIEARIARLDEKSAALEESLQGQRGRLAVTLAALQRLAINPTAAVLARPGKPDDTVRSALLLRTVIPHIEKNASTLQKDIVELAALRRAAEAERTQLAAKGRELEAGRTEVETLLTRKRGFYERTAAEREEAAKRIKSLRKEAASLKDLLARLDKGKPRKLHGKKKARGKKPGSLSGKLRDFEKSRGRMKLPARGSIARQFGERNDLGHTSRGLVIQTREGARAVAPFDGKVVFAGPFKNMGQILIIEHRGGYHTILAGFSRIDSLPDQWVLAGEPVGIVGQYEAGRPSLYVELRKQGKPINPLPWMTAQR